MGIEELLDVPAFGKLTRQRLDRIAVRGGEEGVEIPLIGSLPLALDQLAIGARLAVVGSIRQGGRGIAGPPRRELLGRDRT